MLELSQYLPPDFVIWTIKIYNNLFQGINPKGDYRMETNRSVSLGEALRYRGKVPMLTYILHRIGGISLVLFLGLRILIPWFVNIPRIASVGKFIGSIFASWPFQVYIVFFVLFHMVNGLRIVILDLWPKLIEHQQVAIWVEFAIFLPIYAILLYMVIHTGLGG